MKKGYKECPFCGEEIKEKAVKCLHCKEYLDDKKNKKEKIIEEKEIKIEENSSKKIEKADSEEINVVLDVILKYIGQLIGSIIVFVLRILGFIIYPLHIKDKHDEVEFMLTKFDDELNLKKSKGIHYLYVIYMVVSIVLPILLCMTSFDYGFYWNDFIVALLIYYGYHSTGCLTCLILCRTKYKDEYKEYVKKYENDNKL